MFKLEAMTVVLLLTGSLAVACGHDSNNGSGITPELAALIQPSGPLGVTATPTDDGVRIEWLGHGDTHHYAVYRRLAQEEQWVKLTVIASSGVDDNGLRYSYLDTGATSGRYAYGVSVVALNYSTSPPSPGLESPVSEAITAAP